LGRRNHQTTMNPAKTKTNARLIADITQYALPALTVCGCVVSAAFRSSRTVCDRPSRRARMAALMGEPRRRLAPWRAVIGFYELRRQMPVIGRAEADCPSGGSPRPSSMVRSSA
jgi:hypothetical protein